MEYRLVVVAAGTKCQKILRNNYLIINIINVYFGRLRRKLYVELDLQVAQRRV